MNATKLSEATRRLELLYWDCHRNGGPDVELLAILRPCGRGGEAGRRGAGRRGPLRVDGATGG